MKCWLIPLFSFILSCVFIGISWAQATGDIPTVINDNTAISLGFALLIIGTVAASLRKTGKYDAHICDESIHRSTEKLINTFVQKNECVIVHKNMEEKIDEIYIENKEIRKDMSEIRKDMSEMKADIAVLLSR
jgi:hypothetical protein